MEDHHRKQYTAFMTKPIRLTEYAHGGGCGCKISPSLLETILRDVPLPLPNPKLLVGNESADDAAVYLLNDEQALIATTDFFTPIVDDPFDFGRIAATNALSDIYAMGGEPILALAIVGMPIDKLAAETIGRILAGGQSVCSAVGITIAGGHSIDTPEPIYGLAVMGLAHPQFVRKNCNAKAGDVLILAKPLGIGILSAALKKAVLSDDGYAEMVRLTTQLNRIGSSIAKLQGVTAMTDVTGFGLAGHALEMARGANLELQLDFSTIPLIALAVEYLKQGYSTGASTRNWQSYSNEIALENSAGRDQELSTAQVQTLLTDPQTSGGLLISCMPASTPQVLETLLQAGFSDACQIGQFVAKEPAAGIKGPAPVTNLKVY